jgi:4-aminobutyrate aminotransferase-like enzyme/Ser/Thr protein kinase RdoA (MazF antagonist)
MTNPARLIALETSPPAFATREAERLAREVFGVAGEARLLYGERDQNFRIKSADGPGIILKILGPGEDPLNVAFQTEALDHIAMMDSTLPVPRVARTLGGELFTRVPDANGTPHIVRALQFQSGTVMDSVDPTPALLRHTGTILARLNLALGNFFHPGAGQKIVWDLRAIPAMRPFAALIEPASARAMVEQVLDRFIAFLPQLARLRHQMVHNDLHPGNMLVNDDAQTVTGLLDFGDMLHAPLIFDPAVTAAETAGTMDPVDYAAQIIAGYHSTLPLRDEEFPALYECIIARHALASTILAWRRHNDPAGAEKLGALGALGLGIIETYLATGKERVVERFRAAAATQAGAGDLQARRFAVLGRGLELSYEEPVALVRGEGVFLYGPKGERYLDAYNNVPSVGHGNPAVAEAIARQMRELCTNTRYLNHTLIDYAEHLTATLPAGLSQCLFVNSGSEANDAAWRIAKLVTGKKGAIVMQNAYHGVTDQVAALSPYYGPLAQPQADFVQVLEAPDLYRGRFREPDAATLYAEDADRAIAALEASGHGVAMLLIDSAFVSNGILDVPPGYFAAIATKVRAAGGLVVGDEVQSGFGRMGAAFWGFNIHGVTPDIVTMGKPMANGHPTGALVTRPEFLSEFTSRIDFFSTFGGNQVSASAALATLQYLQAHKLQENAEVTGAKLRDGLRSLGNQSIGNVRGSGLMVGAEIIGADGAPDGAGAKRLVNALRRRHVLIGTEGPHGNVLKIRPPLPFGPAHAATLLEALAGALEDHRT